MAKLALMGGKKLRTTPFPPHPVLGDDERELVMKVLDSGMISGFIANSSDAFYGGPMVKELEADFRKYFGSGHAVAVNSATAGLHCAVAALGLGPGDEVIVSPYTMSASASAIIMGGAIPVFADIHPDTFCLDPDAIRKTITPRTRAIMVVHLFGQAADMDEIMQIAAEHGLKVIEDTAQAPGARYKGRLLGTIGDVGVFSLNQHKTITTGEGGVAITNDDRVALGMQLVRNHGEVIASDLGVESPVNTLGWNYRMTELEAAVGIAQFGKLDMLTGHRVALAEHLTQRLSGLHEALVPPHIPEHNTHVYFVYPVLYDSSRISVPRDVFVKALVAEGIPFGAGYVKPIYLEPMYQKKLCYGDKGCPFECKHYEGSVSYDKGICPVAEEMHFERLILSGICRYPLEKSDIDDVASAIEKVLENIGELEDYSSG